VDNNEEEFPHVEYPEADEEEPQEMQEIQKEQGANNEEPQEIEEIQEMQEIQEDQGVDPEEPQETNGNHGMNEAPQEQGAYNAELNEQPQPQQVRYSLRNRTNRNSAAFKAAMDSPHNSRSYFPPVQLLYKDIFSYVMAQMESDPEFAVTMTQMSANAGIKNYGRKAEEALLAEFAQLDDLDVYEPLSPNKAS
jgi:hypothetical protein